MMASLTGQKAHWLGMESKRMNKWKLEDPSEGELENQAVHFIFGVVKRQGAIAAVGNEDIV